MFEKTKQYIAEKYEALKRAAAEKAEYLAAIAGLGTAVAWGMGLPQKVYASGLADEVDFTAVTGDVTTISGKILVFILFMVGILIVFKLVKKAK